MLPTSTQEVARGAMALLSRGAVQPGGVREAGLALRDSVVPAPS